MRINAQGSRRFLGVIVILWLVMGATATAAPTLAGPPDPVEPRPEPFHIRLEQPLTGAGATGETALPLPIRPAAAPGTWYNLMAQEFDSGDFPPAGWEVDTKSGVSGWAKHSTQYVSASYSAGVVTTTTGLLNTWLIYGGDAGLAVKNVADAKLSFNYWLDTQKDAVYFGWAASADGQNFYGARVSGRVSAWLTGEFDLRQYIGDESVWLAFFVMGQATSGNQRVYIDNVTAKGQEPFKLYLPLVLNNYQSAPATFTFTDSFANLTSGWPHRVDWGTTDEEKLNIRGYTDKLMADYPGPDAYHYNIIGGDCRQAGKYFMRVGNPNAPRVVARAPVQVGENFTLEADIAFCDEAHNASAGVVFGLNDAETEFFRVILIHDAVDNTTKYAIWRDGVQLVATLGSSYLQGGYNVNHVKVVRDGCTISVYFNDHLERVLNNQCEYRDPRWVGLFHDRYSYIGFTGAVADDFRVEGALNNP